MDLHDILENQRSEILRIAHKHGVGKISVFGSVARREAKPDSDVDFLIEVTGQTTSWFPGGLVADLEELRGRRVDIVEPDFLRKEFKEQVCREAIAL